MIYETRFTSFSLYREISAVKGNKRQFVILICYFGYLKIRITAVQFKFVFFQVRKLTCTVCKIYLYFYIFFVFLVNEFSSDNVVTVELIYIDYACHCAILEERKKRLREAARELTNTKKTSKTKYTIDNLLDKVTHKCN